MDATLIGARVTAILPSCCSLPSQNMLLFLSTCDAVVRPSPAAAAHYSMTGQRVPGETMRLSPVSTVMCTHVFINDGHQLTPLSRARAVELFPMYTKVQRATRQRASREGYDNAWEVSVGE